MNLRWLVLDLVPPELNITIAERVKLRRRISRIPMTQHERRKHLWMTLGLAAASVAVPVTVAIMMRKGDVVTTTLLFTLFILAMWVAFAAIVQINNRRRVCVALRELGYDVCIRCGYWLRGLGDDVKQCPECGAEREAKPGGACP